MTTVGDIKRDAQARVEKCLQVLGLEDDFTGILYSAIGAYHQAIALDPDDPAALAVVSFNHTVEPTYTADAQLYSLPLNQRATYRWVASPGSAFKCPATATTAFSMGVGPQASTRCTP